MILNGPGISYTEPDIGAEFVPPLPEHPREAIVKLCEHCTNRLLHRDELLGYEYWSFAEAATDEQAEVLCKMKMRRPYTLLEMVKLTGMPEADIEKMLDDMSYVQEWSKSQTGLPCFRTPVFLSPPSMCWPWSIPPSADCPASPRQVP